MPTIVRPGIKNEGKKMAKDMYGQIRNFGGKNAKNNFIVFKLANKRFTGYAEEFRTI